MSGSYVGAGEGSSGKGWEDYEREDLSEVIFGNKPQKREGVCVVEESSGAPEQEQRGSGII